MQTHSLGNILREVPIDLSEADFIDPNGFFIRSAGGGTVTYYPMNNTDDEAIVKTLPASEKFEDPVLVRRVSWEAGQGALDDLYAGYGV